MMLRKFITHEVHVGTVAMGGSNNAVVQTMTNTPTLDIEKTKEQSIVCIEAGSQLIRISAKNSSELKAIYELKKILREHGYKTPVIADIHFSSDLAVKAAEVVEKVRINPGNFIKDGSDASEEVYFAEIQKRLLPLIDVCRKNNTAIRIGTNHGSLSERIKKRFGTGPQAMAEASMEFVRIIAKTGYKNVILSVKASNAMENIYATRMLAQMQYNEGFTYPIHLGVTEAGLGFSGRIKSAVGIGALLADGIGDTLRVSLTEQPEREIPVAIALSRLFAPEINHMTQLNAFEYILQVANPNIGSFCIIGHSNVKWKHGLEPDVFTEDVQLHNYHIIETQGPHSLYDFRKQYVGLQLQQQKPVIWKRQIDEDPLFELRFAAELGNLLSYGCISGCMIEGTPDQSLKVMETIYEVLQVCNVRTSHVEFISCPSCNRTSFDIMDLAEEVRSKTWHMSHLKIAVMGCIVNGPGEMGNSDFGLVGMGKGLLALYKQGEMIEKDIPESEACSRLLREIDETGIK